MTDCKHDWHFIHGTSRLECRRCKAETGPSTPEQLTQNMMQDVLTMGSAWSKGGERIDPVDVYKTTEYDTTQFYMPTGQLQVANFKPNYNLTFHRDGQEIGKFDFNGPEMIFEGDAAESAKVFIECVANAFHGRLEQERGAGRQEALASRPAQVSPLEFVTMTLEKEHLIGNPMIWAEWPNKENT
jgi:hypothetical protein